MGMQNNFERVTSPESASIPCSTCFMKTIQYRLVLVQT